MRNLKPTQILRAKIKVGGIVHQPALLIVVETDSIRQGQAVRELILGICVLFLTGCATPVSNYQPVIIAISEPPIGEVRTANVGDELLKQGKYQEHSGIRLNDTIKIGMLGSYTFFPGEYVKTGANKKGTYYLPSGLKGGGKVQTSALADPFQAILVKPEGGSICGVSVFDAYSCVKTGAIQNVTIPVLTDDSFQQTLIYSGQVGEVLKIGYREFSGSVARPAFNNDVEYDLSQSKLISYKGAQLEVLEANNQIIRYRVVRNFNGAQ